mgnify:CR=1 FL=1
MLFVCTIYWSVFASPVQAETAEGTQNSNSLLEKIIQGSPSKMESSIVTTMESATAENVFLQKNADYRMLQERNRITLLITIMISTPIILGIVLYCLKNSSQCSEESLVNAIGLVLVIEGTIFIAVSAATTEQLTAPIGILGAIAGYLFGSAKRRAMEQT